MQATSHNLLLTETVFLLASNFVQPESSNKAFLLVSVTESEHAPCVNEKDLAALLVKAALISNVSSGNIEVVQSANVSISSNDAFYLKISKPDNLWPAGSLEFKLMEGLLSKGSPNIFLSDVIRLMITEGQLPMSSRDICWWPPYGLFLRGLLTADETTVRNPFDNKANVKYRGGPYKPVSGLAEMANSKYLEAKELIDSMHKKYPQFFETATLVLEKIST